MGKSKTPFDFPISFSVFQSKTPFVKYDRWCFWFRTGGMDNYFVAVETVSKKIKKCRRWDLNPHDLATTGT